MTRDLTKGNEMKVMLLFSLPMILGNLLQQLYNVVDTLIVGRYLGSGPLAAVGSSYTLMVFLTSINLGLCMGSGIVFSQLYGAKKIDDLKSCLFNAFVFIGLLTVLINILAVIFLEPLLSFLNIQPEVLSMTKSYLQVILGGMIFTFIFNFFAAALRSIGNSLMPLIFLAIASVLNIVLDIIFILPLNMGVAGAAWATVTAQAVSAAAIIVYFYFKAPLLRPGLKHMHYSGILLKRIISNSILSSVQQSIMNFGILMVQGLINSFGVAAMAAYAAAVKIDSLAYMPVQDFGNAFSTFIAQNYGAAKPERIKSGIKNAVRVTIAFCLFISVTVVLLSEQLMLFFINPGEIEIIAIGASYLRIEAAFYCLIGCLFLLYGFYRGISRPMISVILSIISLGTRVSLAHMLAPIEAIGLAGIWWAIPIGWILADIAGFGYYALKRDTLFKINSG